MSTSWFGLSNDTCCGGLSCLVIERILVLGVVKQLRFLRTVSMSRWSLSQICCGVSESCSLNNKRMNIDRVLTTKSVGFLNVGRFIATVACPSEKQSAKFRLWCLFL